MLPGIALVYLFGNQGLFKGLLGGASIYGPLGIVLGLARVSPWRWLRWPVSSFVFVVRGLPLLMVIFWAYFFLPSVTGVKTEIAPLARLLHAHDAILCLDAAASATRAMAQLSPASGSTASVVVRCGSSTTSSS